ncbi:LysR family transcriptional regulator [Actinophytocola sp. NPDC049390]|uniref:LysR family transcriptional regulator n=1 Tax=Actinophytocola sp. NPDC049390 TaxID=3363894 RepID=UPI00379F87FE
MSGRVDVNALRLLVLVGELGSIGRAATATGITQPSASARLAALERSLGVPMLTRDHRGTRLTDDGTAVTGWATRVLDELDALRANVSALRERHEAHLRVGASMTLAEHLVPRWIGALRQGSPSLHVGLQVANSAQVVDLVRQEGIDLGFIESPGEPAGLAHRRVATDRLVVVVPPTHPWAGRATPLRPEDLAAVPLVTRESGSGTRDTVDAALAHAGVTAARPALELGSAAAVRSAVLAGAGPAVMSELAIAGDLTARRLASVPVTGVGLHRTLRAVWPGGRRLTGPAARLLSVALAR